MPPHLNNAYHIGQIPFVFTYAQPETMLVVYIISKSPQKITNWIFKICLLDERIYIKGDLTPSATLTLSIFQVVEFLTILVF